MPPPRRRALDLSLHAQLLAWLVLPQLVLWVAGGIASYRLAVGYASQAIDASLTRATGALSRQVRPLGNGLLIDFPRAAQDVLEADPKDRLMYTVSSPPGQFILGNKRVPAPPSGSPTTLNRAFLYDGEMALQDDPEAEPRRVRVAALYLSYGEDDAPKQTLLVQVARDSADREAIARNIGVDMLLPLSSLVALMTMVVWAGIRGGLAPLAKLRREVEGRAPNDLAPISLASAPPEVRSLVRALNELLGAVQQQVAAQKNFIANAAHQLRTPLAGLKSQVELALASTDPADVRVRLERIFQSSNRSTRLVNQLLTLARAEPETATAQDRTRVDLRRLGDDLAAEQVPRALRAGIDLGVDAASADAVVVHANPLLLREALFNLIDNAIRYAGAGAEVTIKAWQDGRLARLEVSDTGPGMSEATRERAFERFVRGSSEGDGCGLGLAIVKEIVERHGGSVALQPVLPHGLTVVLTLPLAPPDAA